MRVALFIAFYGAFYVPCAFSEVSPHDWAGFHTGLISGAQFGRSSDKTSAFGYNADNNKWDYSESGFTVGEAFGYNFSWRRFIAGPEIELGYLGMEGSGAQPDSPGFDTIGKSSGDFYMAFRARLGVDFDRYLLFATGGAIGVNSTQQVVDNCTIAPCGGSAMDAQKNSFVWGYTVGGGVEHLFGKRWSAKLECLYFNLDNNYFNGTTNLGYTYDWSGHTLGYIIRGGLNYHF